MDVDLQSEVTQVAEDTNTEPVYPRVNAGDCDIILRSSDKRLFHVHRKNLAIHSEVLASAESISASRSPITETVDFTETFAVLEVLLQFMYRQPIPDLSEVDFELLAGVAEAAEKYQIYSAMEVCKLHMRDHMPLHPFEVLVYAHRHGYVRFMDIAAPKAIGQEKLEKSGQDFRAVWIRYQAEWKDALIYAYSCAPDPHPSRKGPCSAWTSEYASVCRGLGGQAASLKQLGAVFKEATDSSRAGCSLCYNDILKWKKKIADKVSSLPKFSTFC